MSPVHLLVIDEAPADLALARSLLARAGTAVSVCGSVAQALALAADRGQRFDAAFLGPTADAAALRAEPAFAGTTLVRVGGPAGTGCDAALGVPFDPAEVAAVVDAAARRPALGHGAPRVLVVEDDPASAELVVERLAALGCEAIVARNQREAMRLALAGRVDLAIVDLHLERSPEEGLALIRALQAAPATATLPIVVHSAFADALPLPSDLPTLPKPFALADLASLVRRFGVRP